MGNRTLLTDPDAGLTTYSWDSQNRLIGIVNPFAEVTTIAYDALDRELKKTLGNGVSVSHTYDPAGRETVLGNYGLSGIALGVFSSTYDAADNRLTVLEVDGTRVTFSYDPSYQLVNEQRNGVNAYNTTYSYDPAGNRLVKIDSGALTTSTYNAANELVLLTQPSGPPTTSSYDANGNLTLENAGGALTSYSWDFENRLTVYAAPTGTETYTYSTDGLRQQKVNSQGTTNYVWDNQNVLLESNVGLITQAHYTDFPGTWGGLASESRSGTSSYYGFDSQSSARILVSTSGLVTDVYSYKAFGEELASGSETVNPYRYVGGYGYYRDIATRQYVRARHTEVTIGRWISRDLLGFVDGPNFYLYTQNQPSTIIDPSGLESVNGFATCFDDPNSQLYCNAQSGVTGCSGFKHGMFTGAWPNVCYECGQCRKGKYQFAQHKNTSGGTVKPVKCGDTVVVIPAIHPHCAVQLKIIDEGPCMTGQATNKIVDLSYPAAQAMAKCLGLRWDKPKGKCKGTQQHCNCYNFDDVNVIVYYTPTANCQCEPPDTSCGHPACQCEPFGTNCVATKKKRHK